MEIASAHHIKHFGKTYLYSFVYSSSIDIIVYIAGKKTLHFKAKLIQLRSKVWELGLEITINFT